MFEIFLLEVPIQVNNKYPLLKFVMPKLTTSWGHWIVLKRILYLSKLFTYRIIKTIERNISIVTMIETIKLTKKSVNLSFRKIICLTLKVFYYPKNQQFFLSWICSFQGFFIGSKVSNYIYQFIILVGISDTMGIYCLLLKICFAITYLGIILSTFYEPLNQSISTVDQNLGNNANDFHVLWEKEVDVFADALTPPNSLFQIYLVDRKTNFMTIGGNCVHRGYFFFSLQYRDSFFTFFLDSIDLVFWIHWRTEILSDKRNIRQVVCYL